MTKPTKIIALIKSLRINYSKEQTLDVIERFFEHHYNELEEPEETLDYLIEYGFDEETYEQFEDIIDI